MRYARNKKSYKKLALVLSLCMILLWTMLGAGASLAWFNDTSNDVDNIFNIANFDLEVSRPTADGGWESIDGKTDVFDDQAIYEPGYVQVVYLKIENLGELAFDFTAAVSVIDYTEATNYYGQKFLLQEYLKFGAIFADSMEELEQAVADRDLAKAIATSGLSNYWDEEASLNEGDTVYMAIIVRMPEEVGNEANYRIDVNDPEATIPSVHLGIVVNATQQRN